MPLITEEKFRIGLVQMSCSQNSEENLAKAQNGIREAAARGAQVTLDSGPQPMFR